MGKRVKIVHPLQVENRARKKTTIPCPHHGGGSRTVIGLDFHQVVRAVGECFVQGEFYQRRAMKKFGRIELGLVGDIFPVPEHPRHLCAAPGMPFQVDVGFVHLAVEADIAKLDGRDTRSVHGARDFLVLAAGLGSRRERIEPDLVLLVFGKMFQLDDRLRDLLAEARRPSPRGGRVRAPLVEHGMRALSVGAIAGQWPRVPALRVDDRPAQLEDGL